ncbi:MAG: hypothetical protein P4L41_11240 [Flavipsychrobacter sp.]|nr:hypothetical protein [Flavipsychrobacter sp.]
MDLRVPPHFNKKTFVLLFIGFIVFTLAGTMLHELGHFLTGRLLGYKGQHISYAFTNMGYKPGTLPKTDEWNRDRLLFIMGGPLQTIATGTLSFLLLYLFCSDSVHRQKLKVGQWLLILLSLFWLRELFDFVCAVLMAIIGTYKYTGDEFKIALQLHWNRWLFSSVLALIAFVVLVIITFRFVPVQQRFTFLIAGLIGGIAGAVLWLVLLGPVIMP